MSGYVASACATLFSCATSENSLDTTLGHIQVSVEVQGGIASDDAVSLTISSIDGKYSHTWEDFRQFSPLEGYYAGKYRAKAVYGDEGSQGQDCPCYIGTKEFEVADNVLSTVNILCTLSQAMVRIDCTNTFLSHWPDAKVQAQSSGYAYVDIPIDSADPSYVMPGSTEFFLSVNSPDGKSVTLSTDMNIDTEPNVIYTLNLDYENDEMTLKCAGKESTIAITDDLFSSIPPTISCIGFADGKNVTLTEGFPSTSDLIMRVASSSRLRSLKLTTIAQSTSSSIPWPDECDLLADPTPLTREGLEIGTDAEGCTLIDFTVLLENLSVAGNSDLALLLQAIDAMGRTSNVASLNVSIRAVEIRQLQITPAVIGENLATLSLTLNEPNVEAKDFSLFIDGGDESVPTPINVESSDIENDSGRISLSFYLPEGLAPVPVRIDYMGKTKLYTTIERKVPEYSLTIDAFATTFMANIIADNPEITSAITRYAHIMVNGNEIAILDRNIGDGNLYCAGLNPSTNYTVESVVIADQYIAKKQIRTESAQQIYDGDMEDVEQIIDYKSFPSGGLYSSSSFAIYNRQNLADVEVFWPKKNWASVNAKTFCTKAKNHNTWYMQPSAKADFTYKFSGNKSVSISSVGWSLTGQDIQPYTQTTDDYLPYNPNTPHLDHISAGYMFLGDYHFNPEDCTETYIQGISFGSRPSSLNGYFKYLPDLNNPSDCGWVKAEVINVDASGRETLLASARMEFQNAPDFRAFNLPLDYDVFYIPATKIRVMFCSSTATDGLSLDDPNVPVSVDVQNSCFIGSTLWIDNLSFSY